MDGIQVCDAISVLVGNSRHFVFSGAHIFFLVGGSTCTDGEDNSVEFVLADFDALGPNVEIDHVQRVCGSSRDHPLVFPAR